MIQWKLSRWRIRPERYEFFHNVGEWQYGIIGDVARISVRGGGTFGVRDSEGTVGTSLLGAGEFSKFAIIFLLKVPKCIILQKDLKRCVNFLHVSTKNANCWERFDKPLKFFDENSMEKLNFKLFLERLLQNIESAEIRAFFYNKPFHCGGWGAVVPGYPPGYATDNGNGKSSEICLSYSVISYNKELKINIIINEKECSWTGLV